MISAFKRGLAVSYSSFTSARSTLLAQLLIVALIGAVTIAGLSYVERHEGRVAVADWMQ
jgi:hypothetical protein